MAAVCKPGRVSLPCKDSQKRSCARQSRLSLLLRIFARLHGGVRIAQQPVDFRSSLRTRGPVWIAACAGMSERSPDCAARNPGLTARLAPDFVSLNPGYRLLSRIQAHFIRPRFPAGYRPRTNRAFSARSISNGVTHLMPAPIQAFGIFILLVEVEGISWLTTTCLCAIACPTK